MDVPSYLLGKKASGGGGGTTDYQALSNKPSINGVELNGNKTTSDLGIETEAIYLGDVTDFTNPNHLNLNRLKKGYYLISCDTSSPMLRLKVKNGENEFFAYLSLPGVDGNNRIKENAIYLYVENEIPDEFDTAIKFGKCSYELYNANTNYIDFRKSIISINSNSISIQNTFDYFNLSVIDKAQTISGKKTFTTLPESSVAPTTDDQLVNKKYVDDNAGGGGASYTAGTNIEITSENVINNKIPYLEGEDQTNIGRVIGNVKTGKSISFHSVGIGNEVDVTGAKGVAIGWDAESTGEGSVGLGSWARANANYAIAIGGNSQSKAGWAIAIGSGATANYINSIAIGNGATTTKSYQAVIGGAVGPINELAIWNNNELKIMATQEFVQNYLTTVSGYDSTKTQVLKNVNGTMTWVDE